MFNVPSFQDARVRVWVKKSAPEEGKEDSSEEKENKEAAEDGNNKAQQDASAKNEQDDDKKSRNGFDDLGFYIVIVMLRQDSQGLD